VGQLQELGLPIDVHSQAELIGLLRRR